jgi:YD repeat-containing protein
MKLFKSILFLFPAALFIINTNTAAGQQKPAQPKVKSIVVYDEKFDKLVSKKSKESETTYDAHGNIIEEIDYVNNKVDKHFQYQYDASDNKIKELELDASGKVTKTSEYKYDKGLRIEKTIAGADGKVRTKKTYVYTTF